MKILSGIYLIKNLIDSKVYVGSGVSVKRRKYCHFSELRKNKHKNNHLQNAFNREGEKNFSFEILEIVENIDILLEREDYWIDFYKANNPDFGYNIRLKASSNLGFHHSDETKEKISKNMPRKYGEDNPAFGRTVSEETRKSISESSTGKYRGENCFNFGKKQSPELIEKRASANRGKKRSEETKKKMSDAKKGKKMTDEAKKNMSKARTGIPLKEETKKKMSDSAKGKEPWNKGVSPSKETNEKVSLSLVGIKKIKNTSSQFVGVSFDKKYNYWVSYIQKNGKRINLGKYSNEFDAAFAYNEKAKELYGDNARLNIIFEFD